MPACFIRRHDCLRSCAAKVMMVAATFGIFGVADVQGGPLPGTSFAKLPMPPGVPMWLPPSWHALLNAPLPSAAGTPTPNLPATIPAMTADADPTGWVSTYQLNGPTATAGNAFFQSLGTNGRACVTCHLPANGMSISAKTIQAEFSTYGLNNPLFAPVDGATCPNNVAASNRAGSPVNALMNSPAASRLSPYYLLLTKGLFRIALPVPKSANFTVSVALDPYGCNTNSQFTQVTDSTGAVSQILSLYRRPLMAANLKFKIITAANTGLFPGTGLAVDPFTGLLESGNIMWDGREATLESQATDATLGHAQALSAPTAAQVVQIVAYEAGIYAAQVYDNMAQNLALGPVGSAVDNGGPAVIAITPPGTTVPGVGTNTFALYAMPNPGPRSPTNDRRASIIRGQALFDNKTFQVSNVAGLNDVPAVGNPTTTTCSGCHHQINAGTDAAPNAAFDIGIGGTSQAFNGPAPATDLPVFVFTCKAGSTTKFHNAAVVTNDPGAGLISGKCADIGKFIVPDLRALAARAPYFHDGSAATLDNVVDFYNARFRIGFSTQDKADLVNFLNAL